jgi:hypothetical protein
MKASTTMSAEAVGAGFLWKLGSALGAGVLGAAIMACLDPPATRKELFKQASVAGVGSMIFGPLAVRVFDHYIDFVDIASSTTLDALEWTIPIFFLVGAMSWGVFGAIAKLRKLVSDRAAAELARKFGVEPLVK